MLALSLISLLPGALAIQFPLSEGLSERSSASDTNVPDLDYWTELADSQGRSLCYLEPDPDGGDDAPAIADALNDECRQKSIVVLPGPVYNINSTMNTTDLEDVVINQYGRLLWTPQSDYWLSVSMPVGFQNQSTVWYFGGSQVVWDGHGVGTLDGNGQTWYDWDKSQGNLAHRPMNVNYRWFSDSIVKNLRFVQSQMWTMAIMYSRNLLLEDIYVNNTSTSEWSTLNTDGADTLYSDNITFSRWSVTNGDDGIALKGNSSNIFVYDSEFWDGQGIAIGSLGQYLGAYEYVDNFYARNLTLHNTARAMYLKTWPGNQNGYPPNGGGGGKGYARNIVMEDIKLDKNRAEPFWITQCENYEGHSLQDCDSSEYHFSDVVWKDISGTTVSDVVRAGWFICSHAAGGCSNLTVEDFAVRPDGSDDILDKWHCHNVTSHTGFVCENSTTVIPDASSKRYTDGVRLF